MESQPGSPRGHPLGQRVSLPSREMAKLTALVGYWSIVEAAGDENARASARGSCVIRAGPGDLSLILDEVVQTPERTYVVHGIVSWESALDCYRFLLADSRAPGLRLLSGSWEGMDLHFRSVPESGTGGLWRRVRLSDIEPGAFTMTVDSSEAAEPLQRTVRRYARKGTWQPE